MDIHDLTAAYALDALDQAERARSTRRTSRAASAAARSSPASGRSSGSLALAAGGPPPPAALRERILEQARSRAAGNVVPLAAPLRPFPCCSSRRRRRGGRRDRPRDLGDVALERARRRPRSSSRDAGAVAILADPQRRARAHRRGRAPRRVRDRRRGDGASPASSRAPAGKTYEIWVIEGGKPAPRRPLRGRRHARPCSRSRGRCPTTRSSRSRSSATAASTRPTGTPIITLAWQSADPSRSAVTKRVSVARRSRSVHSFG